MGRLQIITALTTIASVLVATVSLAVQIVKPDARPWIAGLLLVPSVLAFLLGGSIWICLILKKMRSLPIRLLRPECASLLQGYHQLAFDFKEEVRFPLRNESLPEYGSPWQRYHVELAVLNQRLRSFIMAADLLWKERGWQGMPHSLFEDNYDLQLPEVITRLELTCPR